MLVRRDNFEDGISGEGLYVEEHRSIHAFAKGRRRCARFIMPDDVLKTSPRYRDNWKNLHAPPSMPSRCSGRLLRALRTGLIRNYASALRSCKYIVLRMRRQTRAAELASPDSYGRGDQRSCANRPGGVYSVA